MATGRQVQLTKQVGEYLVAAELSRRGLLTATFAGNVPDYDIVATGGRGQTALVQVKAIAGPSWQFDIRTFTDVRYTAGVQTMGQPTPPPAGDLICVFVRLNKEGRIRSGPLLRAPLAGTPTRAHQRLPGLPGAPRRSASQAGRLLPHGAPGNVHRALPGQLGALRRVHGVLEDGSWCARRPQCAPLAAAGAGRDWGGASTTTRGRRAGDFSRTR